MSGIQIVTVPDFCEIHVPTVSLVVFRLRYLLLSTLTAVESFVFCHFEIFTAAHFKVTLHLFDVSGSSLIRQEVKEAKSSKYLETEQ